MQDTRSNARSGVFGAVFTVLTVVLVALALWRLQDIQDFLRLYSYTPPTEVASLATTTSMSEKGRKLFYVNKPQLLQGPSFSGHCPVGAEKTVVLGCYKSNDNGIYLFHVTDERLQGVVEVTAAHEMLHAAYMRLSDREKAHVDALLDNYYKHSLSDPRIKETIDAYRQSEPSELLNEMHSIFGTEIAKLPEGLERYYAQYFENRQAVVGMLQHYQAEFSGRQQKIASFDARLATLKSALDAEQSNLKAMGTQLQTDKAKLERLRSSGSAGEYNAAIDPYNRSVASYNGLLRQVQAKITEYNTLVESRNAIALEQRQLMQSLSSTPIQKSP